MRIFKENEQTPVIVMSELTHNTSTSVRNMIERLVLEPIPQHFQHRFEELPPVIFLKHYVEELTAEGRLGRKATWDGWPSPPGRLGGSGSLVRDGSPKAIRSARLPPVPATEDPA